MVREESDSCHLASRQRCEATRAERQEQAGIESDSPLNLRLQSASRFD